MQSLRISCAICLVAGASIASAQQPPPAAGAPTHGVIIGAVVDSIRGGVVRGALIAVENVGRTAITDLTGHFTLDSVPPGDHRLVLFDDLLDTLGLSVVTPLLTVTAGDTVGVVMSIPSAATIVGAKCGSGPPAPGTGALIGIVIDAETEKRVPGADILLAWSEVQASLEVGVRNLPRQRTTKSAEDGSYRICGLPLDVNAELMSWRGRDTTAALPFRFQDSPLAIYTVALPGESYDSVTVGDSVAGPPAAVAGQEGAPRLRRGRATIRGMVTAVTGAAISGARVSVSGAEAVAMTNDRGEFVLSGLPSGSQTAQVRRLGYEPVEFAVNLTAARPVEVEVEMGQFVPVLSEVVVQGRLDAGLDRVGFAQRQRRGIGRYLGLEEIERRGALRLVDLLAGFPMLRSVPGADGRPQMVGRGRGGGYGCVNFVVDGMPWLGEEQPTEFVHPQEVGALEVYSAGTAPVQFGRSGSTCETVVIWTRHRLGIR